ncbi:hypothetical protein ETH_00003115 [Eimeria tenella]|uniref:MIF4G-like type 2 domain-containing protein n=1 Tax=Eimeria tenella TaxID=5802 RepID=U6LAT1_EIMTE|nr:hypothetical protein ETH_00003115 [Eimeria tenella]CDJ44870.1 hypothetical protein ETH_00003115 [Eimeria tenella]|eukprot:XP_013235617.1 hypothetical protein ETH_00003115 [Eimeria tenella]
MLKFSFRGEEEKKESAVGVYRLLVSLVGRHKSKGPLVPPQKFQVEENSEERAEGAMDTDGAAEAAEGKDAAAEGEQKEAAAAADAAADATADAAAGDAAAAGAVNGSNSPAAAETLDGEAADSTAAAGSAAAAAAAEDDTVMEEESEKGEQRGPPRVVDTSILETCCRDTSGAPWTPEEALKLFVFCLLSFGSKTQTHLNRILSNYLQTFICFANQSEDPAEAREPEVDIHPAVLQAVQKFWSTSQQRTALTLHAFLKSGILQRARVLQELCAADANIRDSWGQLELVETVLRGALDECENAREEAAAASAPMPTNTEAEQLLHFLMVHLIEDLIKETSPARSRFLFLRCIFFGRKYAEFINLQKLKEEVEMVLSGIEDRRVSNLLIVIGQVQKHYCSTYKEWQMKTNSET